MECRRDSWVPDFNLGAPSPSLPPQGDGGEQFGLPRGRALPSRGQGAACLHRGARFHFALSPMAPALRQVEALRGLAEEREQDGLPGRIAVRAGGRMEPGPLLAADVVPGGLSGGDLLFLLSLAHERGPSAMGPLQLMSGWEIKY